MKPINTIKFCLSLILFGLSFSSHAEGGSVQGDEFRSQATEYAAKAYIYRNKGQNDIAALFIRMSNIKKYAAALVDNGRWTVLDWESFYRNARKISAGESADKFIATLTPLSSQFEETIAAK